MVCTNSTADTSVFIYVESKNLIYILIDVDDIIFTGSSLHLVSACIHVLSNRLSFKQPVDLNYFLGIEVTRTAGGLHPMQRQYIIDILAKVNTHETNHTSMPLDTFPKLTLNIGNVLDCPCEFQMVSGNLQYLAFTRPKIAYSVNRLHNLCISRPMSTGKRPSGFSDISPPHCLMASTFRSTGSAHFKFI